MLKRDQSVVLDLSEGKHRLRGRVKLILSDSVQIELNPAATPEELALLAPKRALKVELALEDGLRWLFCTSLGPVAGSNHVVGLTNPTRVERIQRRRFVRLHIPVSFSYTLVGNGAVHGTTTTVDLSGGGLAFRLSTPLAIGALLDINLVLPGEPPLHATGKVVRARTTGQMAEMGAQFIHLPGAAESALRRFLQAEELKRRKLVAT